MRTPSFPSVALAVFLSAGSAFAGEDREAMAHFAAGSKAFEAGDLPKAIEELEASVKAAATGKALLLLGNVYTKADRVDDAKATFQRWLQVDPRSSRRATVEQLLKDLDVMARTKLKISSDPPGATVYLGLKAAGPRGKTPVIVPVTPGRARVILELAGYDQAVIPNAVAVENQEVAVAATLQVIGCDAALSALPKEAAASARIDGSAAIALPATVRIATGAHKVEFAAAGMVPKLRQVTCEPGKALSVEEALAAPPSGTLAIRAPEGSRITIDGKPGAASTTLAPGEHPVAIEAQGFQPWRGAATVRAGERTDLAPTLERLAPLVAEPKETPVYRRWWLWTAVVAAVLVVGGGVTTLVLLLTPKDAPLPAGSVGEGVVRF
ncbi:MAG: PEGA domain-containing protein [Myxococcales bacterium]|nr:PEGA domain-containing protein [Myxococcales bacterium]